MKLSTWVLLFGLLLSQVCWAICQPKLVVTKPSSYVVGDQVERDVAVLDSDMKLIPLLDTLSPNAKVAVVIFFGGAANEVPHEPFRGRLWCEDSFDDLGIQRALVKFFAGRPVDFISVAIPPVYSTVRYGFETDVFLDLTKDPDNFKHAVRRFIQATELERESTLLPFDRIYYDPRADLLRKTASEGVEGKGESWHGRWKWHLDPRKYGTPTIWLISREGKILREPFLGNDYDAEPPEINYGFHEVREAIHGFRRAQQGGGPLLVEPPRPAKQTRVLR